MSLPRTSRELLHAIVSMTDNNGELDPGREDEGIALIDAWVRVRETQEHSLLLKRFYHWIESNLPIDLFESAAREFGQYSEEEAALAAARKELEPGRMQPAGEANERS